MKFEWDDRKRSANLEKHGLDFADAPAAFAREALVIEDRRKDYGEPRYILLGPLNGRVVVIAFTMRGDAVRIISMRKANARERRAYDERQT